jgi:hypothetical protein
MLNRKTWEAYPIDSMEALGNIYGNRSQTYHPKDKSYRYARLGKLVYSDVVEHVPKHKVVCGREPTGGSAEKVKLLLNGSHIKPQVMRPQHHRGDGNLE